MVLGYPGPHVDTESAGTERRYHVLEVVLVVLLAANPRAPRPVANLNSCFIREQHHASSLLIGWPLPTHGVCAG